MSRRIAIVDASLVYKIHDRVPVMNFRGETELYEPALEENLEQI